MDKNIKHVNSFYLTAGVETQSCPLDWLAEYYREYPGKLVMIDNKLMAFLLNNSQYDNLAISEFDGFKQSFQLSWDKTDEFPETAVTVVSYGSTPIRNENGNYIVESNMNYYVIEELKAEDILVDGMVYAENIKTDRQIIMLTSSEIEESLEQ